ncbi:MAG TPA: cytochrome c-type biogenesis protein CcmH [Gemmatimonadales bacterium]|nr:cytochrome c-type biogenesis protein CcmH [Gemmatimonadales bacterium]
MESPKVSRRDFCGAMTAGFLLLRGTQNPQAPATAQQPLPGSGPAGSLADPERAGRPLDPVTAKDNDAAIQAIEKRLSCTCGCGLDIYTCRTTDFSCTFSPGYHRQILSLAAGGMSGDEIIAEFVKEHGESILMSPPRRGFALLGYYGPWIGMAAAAGGLALLIRAWSRRVVRVAEPVSPVTVTATPAELERLASELKNFEA